MKGRYENDPPRLNALLDDTVRKGVLKGTPIWKPKLILYSASKWSKYHAFPTVQSKTIIKSVG